MVMKLIARERPTQLISDDSRKSILILKQQRSRDIFPVLFCQGLTLSLNKTSANVLMPRSYKLNRRTLKVQPFTNDHQNNRQIRPMKRQCLSIIKLIQIVSAVLVPLMIGVFTLLTTLNETRSEQLRQEAEHRNRQLDILKIQEQQTRDAINAREIQMQHVYDTFMKDISPIVLKENINLTMAEITFARAKTLLTLEQIDPKRKWYLIKFLYDNKLLRAYREELSHLDLTGADLYNVYFGRAKRFNRLVYLKEILLSKVQLRNATFENVDLIEANFDFSDLSYSTFLGVTIARATFTEAIMENSKLVVSNAENASFKGANLRLTSWSPSNPTTKLHNVDYSNCDLSESIFQGFEFRASNKFDGANIERIHFIDISFSNGISFDGKNMQAAKFSNVQLSYGKFIRCNMIGAVFENIKFKDATFEHVNLKESQFNDIAEHGKIQFKYVNLIGSNLNITRENLFLITDSILPNGTFKSSSLFFGVNLIQNGDAEQGQCYDGHQNLTTTEPSDWSRLGDVLQVYYKNNADWSMNSSDYNHAWQSCFFFGNHQRAKFFENTLRQTINVERLSMLINERRVRYHASGYLGGFQNEHSTTWMRTSFKNIKNDTIDTIKVSVTNTDRRNKTAMLYRYYNASIPIGTISIDIELIFSRPKPQSDPRYGMADNLIFILQQK